MGSLGSVPQDGSARSAAVCLGLRMPSQQGGTYPALFQHLDTGLLLRMETRTWEEAARCVSKASSGFVRVSPRPSLWGLSDLAAAVRGTQVSTHQAEGASDAPWTHEPHSGSLHTAV